MGMSVNEQLWNIYKPSISGSDNDDSNNDNTLARSIKIDSFADHPIMFAQLKNLSARAIGGGEASINGIQKFLNGPENFRIAIVSDSEKIGLYTANIFYSNNGKLITTDMYVGATSDLPIVPIYSVHHNLRDPFDAASILIQYQDYHLSTYILNTDTNSLNKIWINTKYVSNIITDSNTLSRHMVQYGNKIVHGTNKTFYYDGDNANTADRGADYFGKPTKTNGEYTPGNPPPDTSGSGTVVEPPKGEEGELYRWIYENMNSTRSFVEDQLYWDQLYNEVSQFKIRSLRSVIGMPFHFMGNVDPSVGDNEFGKQFTEDILFDMPIAMLRPGGPTMNTGILADQKHMGLVTFCKNAANFYSRYIDGNTWKEVLFGDDQEFSWGSDLGEGDIGILEQVFLNLFIGKYARFYTFSQDFTKYVEYVNTLCHLFIHFLGIGDKKYLRNDGECIKYTYYNDTWEMLENDKGETVRGMFGPNRSIYVYYQPESQLNQTYTNTTKPSMLQDTLTEASNVAKEFGFFAGVAGIDSIYDTNKGLLDFSKVFDWLAQNNGSSFISRFLGNATEGISTVIAGNEMDLPEIWDNSTATTSHTLLIKLVSPYGDPESIFLYVLRPLARLLAMSLPRQFGPNSYTSPFLIQAFSKGQFNCQCGIVSSISVQRCGNGGESHSMAIIPTELEVTMEIQDLYELVTLSNEYLGSGSQWNTVFDPAKSLFHALIPSGSFRAARLLFNNIGLIDFCAAYCGFNINSPEQDTMIALIHDMWVNRISDTLEVPQIMGVQKWRIGARLDREMADSFYSSIFKKESFIAG